MWVRLPYDTCPNRAKQNEVKQYMNNRISTAILTALLVLMTVSAMCAPAAAELPATFDWRDVDGVNYVTPVKDQGSCGCCWAFSTLGVVESRIMIDHGVEADLSEQYFVSDCWAGGSCTHGWEDVHTRMFKTVRDDGAMSESCVPYLEANSACYKCDGWMDDLWYIEDYSIISYAESSIKTSIYNNGPVFAIMWGDEFYSPGTSHMAHEKHGVCIVGWNDSVGDGCWIVKNSWNTNWGFDGYGYVLYDSQSSPLSVWNIIEVYNSYQIPPCERYDTNGDPGIQLDEVISATDDYYDDMISLETVIAVMDCYYES